MSQSRAWVQIYLQQTTYQRDPAGGVRWRLIAGNNRSLGTSTSTHRDAERAIADALRLKQRLSGLVDQISTDSEDMWRWWLLEDGARVVHSSRAYTRRVESALSLRQFRTLFAAADVNPTLRVYPPLVREGVWRKVTVA